jgi:hypothetical protein
MKCSFPLSSFLSAAILCLIFACTGKKTEAPKTSHTDTAQTVAMPDSLLYTTEYYNNGTLKSEGHLLKGLREGKWLAYAPDGRIMSTCEYTKGRKNGKSEVYNPNGTLKFTGFYTMDEKSGTWTLNDETGKKVKEVSYRAQTNP